MQIGGVKLEIMRFPKFMDDKRLLLICAVIALLAVGFWAGSRVPELNEKAAMGTEFDTNALGFDAIFQIQPVDSKIRQILYTTVNWGNTNKKGMTFGILFAAAVMTLLSLLHRKSFNNGFANAALGIFTGAPLGVCVNCAAPIAAGMAKAGTRLETTLATMISSPTLNIIVLTMVFTLFPLHIAIIKVGLTLGFILLIIPLLSRFLLRKELLNSSNGGMAEIAACDICDISPMPQASHVHAAMSWLQAVKWTIQSYGKNLWFVLRIAAPLMLLSGFLGAVLITLLPLESLADVIPENNQFLILLNMGVVVIVGIFLPVPMAFDVIVPAALLQVGMPVKYVMILLFTLGIYSIYSFAIVAKAVSMRAAIILMVVLMGLGGVAGVAAHEFDKRVTANNIEVFLEFIANEANLQGPEPRESQVDKGESARDLFPALKSNALIPERTGIDGGDGVEVERIVFQERSSNPGKPFSKFEGGEFGLEAPFEFSFLKMEIPFVQGYGRGVATGDVHGDGWPDVLLQTDSGLVLYANQKGKGFVRQKVEISALDDLAVVNAALVDVNSDGWLDIFFSTFGKGNFIIYNQGGQFTQEQLHRLPDYGEEDLSSVGFGDVDRDGDLDIVLGNWSIAWGPAVWVSSDQTRNILMLNNQGSFSVQPLEGLPGAATSVLLSDFNDDGYLDLVIGNDFGAPDFFYVGDGNGGFKLITNDDGIIPHGGRDTMSLASADINNDLRPEIFIADVASYPSSDDNYRRLEFSEVCSELTESSHRCERDTELHSLFKKMKQKREVQQCLKIGEQRYRQECIFLFMASRPGSLGGFATTESCSRIPSSWEMISRICESSLRKEIRPEPSQVARLIPQVVESNVLLMPTGDGRFVDNAVAMGVNRAGVGWHAKFADLDNDEWQDLYVVNGSFGTSGRESNYFFHNEQGQRFSNETEKYGLASYLATSSFSYVDLDNDGDLDIITVPVYGPVEVYVNNSVRGKSIAFELRDQVGNSFGIGSKITIHYGPDGTRHQMREIQASGGFISFDPQIAYFGLGDYEKVDRVEILWSTGELSEIRGDFVAGARYRILRNH